MGVGSRAEWWDQWWVPNPQSQSHTVLHLQICDSRFLSTPPSCSGLSPGKATNILSETTHYTEIPWLDRLVFWSIFTVTGRKHIICDKGQINLETGGHYKRKIGKKKHTQHSMQNNHLVRNRSKTSWSKRKFKWLIVWIIKLMWEEEVGDSCGVTVRNWMRGNITRTTHGTNSWQDSAKIMHFLV